jgi:hypothetical protein
MERREAQALILYLQRAHGIIPTTGAEYELARAATQTIEAVANGLVTVELKAVGAAPVVAAPAPEKKKPGR